MDKNYTNEIPHAGLYLILRPEDLDALFARVVAKVREDDAVRRREESIEEYGTRADACDFLKISFPTLHGLINQGLVKIKKVGRKTLVDMADLRRAVADGRIVKYQHKGRKSSWRKKEWPP